MNETLLVPVLAGIDSEKVLPLVATWLLFFAHDVTDPQLVAVSVTLPPEAGRDVGDAVSEQAAVLLGAVQLTTILPPDAVAVNVALVHVSDAANVGIGATANPVEATAAASTRLMVRWFVYMVYLEKRRRNAPTAGEQALRHLQDTFYDNDIASGRHPSHGPLPRTNGYFI